MNMVDRLLDALVALVGVGGIDMVAKESPEKYVYSLFISDLLLSRVVRRPMSSESASKKTSEGAPGGTVAVHNDKWT